MFAAPSRVLHRRVSATAAAAALLVAGGVLSSCGFDPPTDRINTIAAGTSERSASVDALGIRVLSTQTGQGRLIGTLVNNKATDAALTAVSGEGVTVELEEIEVAGGDRVNLAEPSTTPIELSGDFEAGQVIGLDLSFETDAEGTETVSLDVPVVKDCYQYTQVPEPEAAETDGAEETDGESTEEASENPAYLCEQAPTDDEH